MQLITVDLPQLVPAIFSRRYMLDRDLEVKWSDKHGAIKTFCVPKGYHTDGASIPKAVWTLIGSPYEPEFITAAIVHDLMCDLNWDVEEMSELFFLLLRDSGVHKVKANLMHDAVLVYKKYINK